MDDIDNLVDALTNIAKTNLPREEHGMVVLVAALAKTVLKDHRRIADSLENISFNTMPRVDTGIKTI